MNWLIRIQPRKGGTMPGTTLHKILIFLLLLALCVSCSPRATISPATASTATPVAQAVPITPEPKQPGRTKQAQDAKPVHSTKSAPDLFPTSSYVPEPSTFNIVLGRPTNNSISASLLARKDTQVTLSYYPTGDRASVKTAAVNLRANVPQTLELTGLTADTQYSYQVSIDGAATGQHTFHTQRTPGSTFTFTLDADPHNRDPNFNGELYDTTLTNALNDHPDFHINLGDTFMTEKVQAKTYAEAESTFTDMRPYFGIIGADAPLFLVNGNHEGEIGWLQKGSDSLPVWSTQIRQMYYPNPNPGVFYTGASTPDPTLKGERDGYYAWTWGDALFVVLDPFWYTTTKPQPTDLNNNWNWTLGKAQYSWLKSTLETSQAKYKFIFIHHLVGGSNTDARGGIEAAPYFEWGGKNADGSYGFDQHRLGWGKPIHQLLVENHVSAVFHGHDHVYVQQELDGIVYQECPQPSITRYTNSQLAQEYGYTHGDVLSSSGHLRVTVSPDQVTVEYVRAYLPKDEKQGQLNRQVDAKYTIKP
jgi:hypothetical protein